MKTVREQLIAARAKVEAGWCQGWFAKGAMGNRLDTYDGEFDWSLACSVCAAGGLLFVGAPNHGPAYKALAKAVGVEILSLWNDSSTKEQVLAGFDAAIAAEPLPA